MVEPAPKTNQAQDVFVFDRDQVKRNRRRAARNFADHGFLFDWAHSQLLDRLADVKRDFPLALSIGTRGPTFSSSKIETLFTMDDGDASITADEEFLPFAQESLDLITSNLNLHLVNDLPGTLYQIRQALKPDGLFLAAMLGGETLHELRNVLHDTEIELHGGISPRVAPFADKPQMGDLLQRAGFALPVVDSELITVTYDHMFKLLHDVRGMGEGNAIHARSRKPLTRSFFMRAAELYAQRFSDPAGKIEATFEIIFLIGWAPHDSQQKPLRPGSAQHSLAEALETQEITTGVPVKP